jgi:hypothetical protein
MEESGRPMRRYGVAAHERVADGRRSVRRRGEETATGGHGWRVRTSSALCSSGGEDGERAGERNEFWGPAWALAHALCQTRRRKHDAAANGSCSRQSSIGEQRIRRRADGDMLEQAQYQGQCAWQSARQSRDSLRARLRAGIVRRAFTILLLYSCTQQATRSYRCSHRVVVVEPALCSAISAPATDRRERSRCTDGTSRLCSRNTTRPVQDMTRR